MILVFPRQTHPFSTTGTSTSTGTCYPLPAPLVVAIAVSVRVLVPARRSLLLMSHSLLLCNRTCWHATQTWQLEYPVEVRGKECDGQPHSRSGRCYFCHSSSSFPSSPPPPPDPPPPYSRTYCRCCFWCYFYCCCCCCRY